MFDACGFILPNFAQAILTCDVTKGKPAAFTKQPMFLKVGNGATQGVASQYQKGSKLDRPSSTTRSLKSCQKRLQESMLEWKVMLEKICARQPQSMPIVPIIAPTISVEPPITQKPLKHISGVVACYKFLFQFIKPEALTSSRYPI
jgi:hypothetical protein